MIEVISLCGIPASGKSSTIDEYIKYVKTIKYPINLIVISFDMIESALQESKNIYYAIIDIWDVEKWHKSREQSLTYLANIVESINHDSSLEAFIKISGISIYENEIKVKDYLIFLDDNMYLSSMRKEIYHVALKCIYNRIVIFIWIDKCSYGIIFFETELKKSLERNRNRKNSVKENIIEKMNERIEIPSNSNKYEENILIYDIEKSNIDSVHNFVLSIINEPVLPLFSDEDLEKKVIFYIIYNLWIENSGWNI